MMIFFLLIFRRGVDGRRFQITRNSSRFRDGQAINCCDDPSDASAAVRAKATIQGVVIGGFPNKV